MDYAIFLHLFVSRCKHTNYLIKFLWLRGLRMMTFPDRGFYGQNF